MNIISGSAVNVYLVVTVFLLQEHEFEKLFWMLL